MISKITYNDIVEKINLGNNGKMMLKNFTPAEKLVIGEMRKRGIVAPATFLSPGDSVKLSELYKKGYVVC